MKIVAFLSCLIPVVLCANDNSCGGTFRGFQYSIASPHYPNNYPNEVKCIYHLEGDATATCEQEFHVQFLDFNVSASDNCNEDYLLIGDRNIFCGNVYGLRRFKGKNNTLAVVFRSDEKNTAKGFKMLVTALPCNSKQNVLSNHSNEKSSNQNVRGFNTNVISSNAYYHGVNKESDIRDYNPVSVIFSSRFLNSSKQEVLTNNQPKLTNIPKDSSKQNPFSSLILSSPSTPAMIKSFPRISSYLFVPPVENHKTMHNDLTTKKSTGIFDTVTSLPTTLLAPNWNSGKDPLFLTALNKTPVTMQIQNLTGVLSREKQDKENLNKKGSQLLIADENEVTDISTNMLKSSERGNHDSLQRQSFVESRNNLESYPSLVYDPQHGVIGTNDYPANIQNPSQVYYGGDYSNSNPSSIYPSESYNPSINYENGIASPSVGYVDSYNQNFNSPNYLIEGSSSAQNYPHNTIYPNYLTGFRPSYSFDYNIISPNNNPIYNSISSNYNPSIPNYNSGYNPGFNTEQFPNHNLGYNPSFGDTYYPNYGWETGFNSNECCRVPSSRRFSLVSPGFPGSLSQSNIYNCKYTIRKYSQDICQVRLKFRFFNFGIDNQYCNYGYVEIDGTRYCGCRTGQTVQFLFTDYIAKSISVSYVGYPRTKFSGFLIDVIQDSCNILEPSYSLNSQAPFQQIYPFNSFNPNYSGYFRRRIDISNSTGKLQNSFNTRNPKDNISPPLDLIIPDQKNRRSGYSYPNPSIPFPTRNVPFASHASTDKTFTRYSSGFCQNRIFLDWAIASKEAIFKGRCMAPEMFRSNARNIYLEPSNSQITKSALGSCEEFKADQGIIKSPLYPSNYPNNINKCYSFVKAQNICQLEIYIRDFELETSQECSKDYLAFSVEDKKYCGDTLNNNRKTIDLRQRNSLEIYFVTDSNDARRGFTIEFSQIPCEASENVKREV